MSHSCHIAWFDHSYTELAHEKKMRQEAEEQLVTLQRKLQSLQAFCADYKAELDTARAELAGMSTARSGLEATVKDRSALPVSLMHRIIRAETAPLCSSRPS